VREKTGTKCDTCGVEPFCLFACPEVNKILDTTDQEIKKGESINGCA
jgi:hypothetical protein